MATKKDTKKKSPAKKIPKKIIDPAVRIAKISILAAAAGAANASWDPFDTGLNLSAQDGAKLAALAAGVGMSALELYDYIKKNHM